jgi:glutamine amidotransferase PdxT
MIQKRNLLVAHGHVAIQGEFQEHHSHLKKVLRVIFA